MNRKAFCAYVKKLNEGRQNPLHDPVYFKRQVGSIEVEVAFQYTEDFGENILGFCNNIYTAEGGTHLTGFKTKFTTIMNQYAREIGMLKEKDANFYRYRRPKWYDGDYFRKTSGSAF